MRSVAATVLAGAVLWGTAHLTSGTRAVTGDADERAHALAQTLRPGYTPWAAPIFTPDDHTESTLFRAQTIAGGVLFLAVLAAARPRRSRDASSRAR